MARKGSAGTRTIPVVVETSQGARAKVEFDYRTGLLKLTKILPKGFTFPLNFGSIPGTLGDDGDPLDILLFMSDPVPCGTLVAARLIGVLEAEQEEKGKTERNDRLFGVAVESTEHRDLKSVNGIEKKARSELEAFFEAYNAEGGKKFRALGWFGPKRASKLIDRGRRRFRPAGAPGLPKSFAAYAELAES